MAETAVFLADGFEEVEAITPIDFLRRAGITVHIVGVRRQVVKGGHDLVVQAETLIDDLNVDLDAVIFPGGKTGAENLAASDAVSSLIHDTYIKGNLVAAICASPALVLYPQGILKGKRFTCYPGFEKNTEGAYFTEKRVVQEGNIITSRGPGSAAEFAIAIIRYLAGDETANTIHAATLQKV
ncbi:MAG: DJ-1/PfpI family protein [Spirochaetales bacterium]|nr:DJ-1/PfpI family protein [Spirochaetales bacterium]MCF7937878.1 DJ-1/PfpI family protein [Spirochaetales bacterium]